MSGPHRPPGRTLIAPRCTFKLYGADLPPATERVLRGIAPTGIDAATAGFARRAPGEPALAVYWWEAREPRRLSYDPSVIPRRPERTIIAVATVDELPMLSFEAESWTRHVLQGRPPSIPSYLAEFHA